MSYFIGLSLPDHISSHLSTLRGSLPALYWNDPDTYHIPLCHLGAIKNDMLMSEIDIELERMNTQRFELDIQGVQHNILPTGESEFSVIVSSTPALIHLKKKIEHIVQQFEIKPSKKRYIPKIALAKGIGISEEQISNWLYQYNLFKTKSFEILQFSLFSTYHTKHSVHYDIQSDYMLR
ncbi:RNA 2',3'-cyclic phosphodiesterase [Commensalibacter communis]|uniref:RNA 2',3'-cyclic phosphodiesterase n=1 Tax=Commensalibacter communis TaxID=2972786 RepID=UPI0022FFC076|nr:RNA 2',3'-cyclic phosphodiesterase [Commensalibacter communis]CAI3947649.1 3'-cyclic phosphodiesterase (2'-5' RNA ligase) (ThpR) (PDB:1IUH) (PUBMED:25239919) [Commensalibacter communis]CAI3947883.1 3'-cyclic phosphodiesterase (2'-5' RNA ligase) (ThpR) (PDB:1IUH) (PUBMED:25239919) [Commensalibacter communis]